MRWPNYLKEEFERRFMGAVREAAKWAVRDASILDKTIKNLASDTHKAHYATPKTIRRLLAAERSNSADLREPLSWSADLQRALYWCIEKGLSKDEEGENEPSAVSHKPNDTRLETRPQGVRPTSTDSELGRPFLYTHAHSRTLSARIDTLTVGQPVYRASIVASTVPESNRPERRKAWPALAPGQSDTWLGRSITSEDLSSVMLASPGFSMLLQGPAGSGKTFFLYRLTKFILARERAVVFFLSLKRLRHTQQPRKIEGSETRTDSPSFESIFTSTSLEGDYAQFAACIADTSRAVVLVIDGVNEIADPIVDIALLGIAALRRDLGERLRVVAADRLNPREAMDYPPYFRGTIQPLSPEEVQAHLGDARLSESALRLAGTPFFLDMITRGVVPASPGEHLYPGEVIRRYFETFLPCLANHSAFRNLAEASFNAYRENRVRSFSASAWSAWLGDSTITERLLESGDLEELPRSSLAEGRVLIFRHQLLHDYLVGTYLASIGEHVWDGGVLDAATFDAGSVEPATFAIEILAGQGREHGVDQALIAVYDWNYSAVLQCLEILRLWGRGSAASESMTFALAASNAAKLFDPFIVTQEEARERIRALKWDLAQFETFHAVRAVVCEKFVGPFFQPWQNAFLLPARSHVREQHLRSLAADPLQGWACANSLREMRWSDRMAEAAEMLYQESLDNPFSADGINVAHSRKGATRWRIVHALAGSRKVRTIPFLAETVEGDVYKWAAYGATRSLLEIAIRTMRRNRELSSLGRSALKALQGCAPRFRESVAKGVFRWVHVRPTPRNWESLMQPILEEALQKVPGADRQRCAAVLERISARKRK